MSPTRRRLITLASLLILGSVVAYANGVAATSSFINAVGPTQILIVWAIDNTIMLITAILFTLVADRFSRQRIINTLFLISFAAYLVLYVLLKTSSSLGNGLLLVLNDQQWLLVPLTIYALAGDVFSAAESKRLFPVLSTASLIGALLGNGLAVALARLLGSNNAELMLFNCAIMLVSLLIARNISRDATPVRRDRSSGSPLETLREGFEFVWAVPAFRYLSIIMLAVGFALNTLEYSVIAQATLAYQGADLATFYGVFRLLRMSGTFAVQSLLAPRLIKHNFFKYIFSLVPTVMSVMLALILASPTLLIIAAADGLTRMALDGIDDPERRAFLSLVPDERRGRVSTFMGGYLLTTGSVVSCIVGILTASLGHWFIGLALVSAMIGVIASIALTRSYDVSLLNYRLQRPRRRSVISDKLNF